jgi:hypothetical protein
VFLTYYDDALVQRGDFPFGSSDPMEMDDDGVSTGDRAFEEELARLRAAWKEHLDHDPNAVPFEILEEEIDSISRSFDMMTSPWACTLRQKCRFFASVGIFLASAESPDEARDYFELAVGQLNDLPWDKKSPADYIRLYCAWGRMELHFGNIFMAEYTLFAVPLVAALAQTRTATDEAVLALRTHIFLGRSQVRFVQGDLDEAFSYLRTMLTLLQQWSIGKGLVPADIDILDGALFKMLLNNYPVTYPTDAPLISDRHWLCLHLAALSQMAIYTVWRGKDPSASLLDKLAAINSCEQLFQTAIPMCDLIAPNHLSEINRLASEAFLSFHAYSQNGAYLTQAENYLDAAWAAASELSVPPRPEPTELQLIEYTYLFQSAPDIAAAILQSVRNLASATEEEGDGVLAGRFHTLAARLVVQMGINPCDDLAKAAEAFTRAGHYTFQSEVENLSDDYDCGL